MRFHIGEAVAVVTSVVAVVGSVCWPLAHESELLSATAADAQVITLTGIAATGTWTQSEVHASNYWQDGAPARPVVRVGRPVVLRLLSADVVHGFYCPELGIGPVEVYPGHVAQARFEPKKTGVFDFYCTTVCGTPHFAMRGQIAVVEEGQAGEEAPPAPAAARDRYWLRPEPTGNDVVKRGEWLFHRMGCAACHGKAGKPGVPNYNFASGSVPSLNVTAEKVELFEPEEVEAVLNVLKRGGDLEELKGLEPLEYFDSFLGQYKRVRDLIRNGKKASKRDLSGPAPPLDMPRWGGVLSAKDIDAIFAYLLTLQPWDFEDEEKAGKDQEGKKK